MGHVSGDLQGGANSVSQVDRVSDMAPACQLCGCVGGGFREGHCPLPAFLSVKKLSPISHRDAGFFSFFLHAIGTFQVATLGLELRGSESE